MASETINHTTLEQLIEANAVRSTTVVGVQGGWSVLVRYGMAERRLAAQRGGVRTWRRLDAVAGYLRGLGLAQFEVDAANHEDVPGQKRPDRAQAMRELHDAAEHDRWFREQVEAAVNKADSGKAEWIEDEEWRRRMTRKREELEARAGSR
jgi:hypothetical protein